MPKPIYQAIEPLSREEVDAVVERDNPSELLIVILSVAIHDEDRSFAELFCQKYSNHSDSNVRGNAILGFAHIARIQGSLNEHVIKPIIKKGLIDENEYVRGHSIDAKEDTEWFLKWKY